MQRQPPDGLDRNLPGPVTKKPGNKRSEAKLLARARSYSSTINYSQAQTIYKDLLKEREEILGPASADTLRLAVELAERYSLKKQYSDAEKLLSSFLSKARKKLGHPDHKDLVGLRRALALIYVAQGKFHIAKVHLIFVWRSLQDVFQEGYDKKIETRLSHQFVDSSPHGLSKDLLIPYILLQVGFELGRTELCLGNYTEAEDYLIEVLGGPYPTSTHPINKLLSASSIDQISGWLGYILFKQEKFSMALQYLLPIQDRISILYNFDGSFEFDISFIIGYAANEKNNLDLAERKFQEAAIRTEEELLKISQESKHAKLQCIMRTYHARAWLDSVLGKRKKHFDASLNLRRMLNLTDDLQQYWNQSVTGELNHNFYIYYAWVKLARTAAAQNNIVEAVTMCHKAVTVFAAHHDTDQSTASEAKSFLFLLRELDKNPNNAAMQAELSRLSNKSLEIRTGKASSHFPLKDDGIFAPLTLGAPIDVVPTYGDATIKVKISDVTTQIDHIVTLEQSQKVTLAITDVDINANANTIASSQSTLEAYLEISQIVPHIPQPTSSAASVLADDQRITMLFKVKATSQQVYQESEIADVKAWLYHSKPKWCTSPRTYIIFRTINRLDLLDRILESGFSDYQLPAADTSLPQCLDAELHPSFKGAQRLVLNTALELQWKGYGKHLHFGADESLPFDIKQRLGSGGFSQVDRIIHRVTQKEYALKRVPRKAVSDGKGFRGMQGIISEIEILKELHHEHIVELVGSYTDHKFLGLLMSPVAEMDLAVYLAAADNTAHSMIRSFYGCLATGLHFLHKNQVRHKDIKPQNILVNNGMVLLADFGLARDFKDATGSTTTGKDNWTTPRYAAPEVMLQEARNTKSDIWSLGVVFLEMMVVLKGHNKFWLDDFLINHGHQSKFVRSNRPGLQELFNVLKDIGSKLDNVVLTWTEKMLQELHVDRPTASMLVTSIISNDEEDIDVGQFCGICCRYDDKSDDDDDNDDDNS